MAWTAQEAALKQAQRKFGMTAYTEDTVNYRLVGYMRGNRRIFCIGDTWEQAMAALEGQR
jgi:hypothetical protein